LALRYPKSETVKHSVGKSAFCGDCPRSAAEKMVRNELLVLGGVLPRVQTSKGKGF